MYTFLRSREVLCALTHLLCRGWARLRLHECTLGTLSRRVSPIQMHLGYSNPHQDLLWLPCTHFSSQQMMMMTSCPWSGMLRMCQQLEWNQTRMLTWGRTMWVCSAPVVWCWEQHWPGVIGWVMVRGGGACSVAGTDSHLDFCLPWSRWGILCWTSLPAMGTKAKGLGSLKFRLHWELVSWKIHR